MTNSDPMLSDLRHERALFDQTFNLASVGMAHLGMNRQSVLIHSIAIVYTKV